MTVETPDLVHDLKVICQAFIEKAVDAGRLAPSYRTGIAIRVYPRADEAPPMENYKIPYRVEVTETADEWEKGIEANEEATRERGYAQTPDPGPQSPDPGPRLFRAVSTANGDDITTLQRLEALDTGMNELRKSAGERLDMLERAIKTQGTMLTERQACDSARLNDLEQIDATRRDTDKRIEERLGVLEADKAKGEHTDVRDRVEARAQFLESKGFKRVPE